MSPEKHHFKVGRLGKPHKIKHVERIPRWFFPTILLVVVLALAVLGSLVLRSRRRPAPLPPPIIRTTNELMTMHRVAGRLLGEYLVARHLGEDILLLVPPAARQTREDGAAREGLLSAVRDQDLQVTVAAPDDDPNAPPGLWLKPEAFDAAVASRDSADVVVSLTGLPGRPERMQFWRWPEHPKLVLFNASPLRLEDLIQAGEIDGIMIRRPSREDEPARLPPDNPRYWLLITPENFKQVTRDYPNLFATRVMGN